MGETITCEIASIPFQLSDTDKRVLSQTDEEYQHHTWDDLQNIIQNNKLHALKRRPSDLRRYIKWTAETSAAYGNTMNYLLAHRLPKAWGPPPFTPVASTPFEHPSDYCVLINDWPYGLAPGITHLVVWTRTDIETDSDKGDLTPESRAMVDAFVKRHFVDRLGPGGESQVTWFKNWVALQSVRALAHIHVLVRDVDPGIIEEWTKEHDWHREP
ncbi:N-acetylglucosamine-induced protein 1 [Echria macrotheca]|uniref:N-acetylglucosamine-induced protein 1 n=1 Tax=Echria macrotheca TaxID=438768 RepID=A0AAJ0FC95_9PEZI|nr:N-acetylglucosamine-induced protein 1 [Echria macrotheca]